LSDDRRRVARIHGVSSTSLALGSLAVLMGLAAIVIYRKGLGTTFYFDEWAFVIDRQPWRWDIVLTPYNGHLSLLPIVVYKLLFMTVGLGPYWVYRLVLLAFHFLCVALLFVYARHRVGDALAVCVAALVLFLGTAWHDLLVPFQIGFLGSVAGGLAMLVALDRRTLAGDVIAAVALAVSLSSSSLGVSFALAALVEVLLRDDRWRRAWIAVLPFALYLVWYVDYRNSPQSVRAAVGPLGSVVRANFPVLGSYSAEASAAAFGGLFGLGSAWGRLLVVGGLALLVVRLGGTWPVSPRLLGLLVATVAYWGLLAIFRAQLVPPDASRYLYGGATLIVLIGLELAAGTRVGGQGLALVGLAVAFAAVGNYSALNGGSRTLQDSSAHVRAELGALEVAGRSVDPNYIPDQQRTQGVRAGRYLAVVKAHGSPADSAEEIAREPEPIRQEADAVLARALGVTVLPASRAGARGQRCTELRPRGSEGVVDLTLPAAGLVVEPEQRAIEFRLRHFADGYAEQPFGTISRRTLIRIGRGRSALDWHLQLRTRLPVRACAARAATA
jgi:hypothetical protein